MESLERKDAGTGPEEPIKSEDVVPSPNTSERANNGASPPPNCSICLGKLVNMSFTDSCLHQFCFSCLLQWSKIKTECPLCKQTFKSIIHNVRSQEDYDQYHVQRTSQVAATLDVTADIHISGQWNMHAIDRPFFYRTTMGGQAQRRYGMLLNPEAVARREQLPSIANRLPRTERTGRTNNPLDYRRTVYRHGVRSTLLPDAFGQLRESNPDFYRRNPSAVNRLVPWLNRELQVLLNNNRPHISYVMGIITDALPQYDIRSEEFRNAVRPYFGIHTDHFAHEFANYARTNFDLVGYDQAVSYLPSRGLSNQYVHRVPSPTPSSSSSSSNDSDVYVLADSNDRISYMPHMIDTPGPSTVGQVFRVGQLPNSAPDVLTISSTSSSSENECEVVGYVKPRHERTPEIIDLSSSDGENRLASNTTSNDNAQAQALPAPKEENLPSTSSSVGNANSANGRTRRRIEDSAAAVQMYTYLDSTCESDSGENDSDYNPKYSRKSRRHKTSGSKKSSKATPRKLRSRKRKKSTSTQQKRDKETRSYYSSCDESDNESPQRVASSSRGKKRYLPKGSDTSESEKVSKKKKKSKKSTSPKKTKKRRVSSTSKTVPMPTSTYDYSSIYSSNSCDDSEPDNSKSSFNSRRGTSKAFATTSYHDYTSEEPSDNDKSSLKSSSAQSTRQESKASSKFGDSDHSDYRRSESSRHSSTGSYDSRKIPDRLQNVQDNSRHSTSEDEMGSSRGSSCSDNESASLDPKRKLSGSKSTATTTSSGQTTSQSSEKSSATASSSNSSSKSDASSPTEHSSLFKSNSRDRHRSHKKRKESKKRRRSHS